MLNSSSVLRLVQITDTHLFGVPNQQLLGINTRKSFQAVLQLMQQQRPNVDAFLLSGDLSQDDSLEAYQYLHDSMEALSAPKFWFTGNHDDEPNMHQVGDQHGYLRKIIRTPNWQVIMLNSQVEGAVFGYLAEDQLQFLQQSLEEAPELHTLISFHHQPIPMESQWIDRIGLRNANEFHELIAKYDNVRAVLWGHVHQESDRTVNNIRYLSTPSTCVQFKPKNDDFAVDDQQPGYRWLDLHPDGTIETAVQRVADGLFLPDTEQNGY